MLALAAHSRAPLVSPSFVENRHAIFSLPQNGQWTIRGPKIKNRGV